MLKKIFFSLLVILSVVNLHAQFNFGFKAGVNAAKIDGKTFRQEFKYNYLAGAFAELGLGRRISFSPEMVFSQTSATRDSAFSNLSDLYNKNQVKAKLNYLSIPLLANIKLRGPLYIEAGPQYSILINSSESLLKNGEKAFKSGDFSFLGGLKFKFSKVRVSGRYVIGLNNINDGDSGEKWSRQAIQVAAGFTIL